MRSACLLMVLMFSPLSGGEDGSLEPSSSPYDFFLSDYRVAVVQTLSEAMGGAPRLQMLVLPSFQPEYVVGIDGGDKPLVRVVTLDAQIWARMQHGEFVRPSSIVKTFRISRQLYAGIEAYVCNALKDVRYHEKESIGFDGVTFHFSAWCRTFGSPAGAKAWNPEQDTDAGRLVAVFQTLRSAAGKTEAEQAMLLDELLITLTD